MMWSLAEVIAGLILLTWGADRFVDGAAAAARKFGVSSLVVGLTILALGTSAPEILVSGLSAFRGEPDLAIGNAIGSNVVNIGLVLGVVALIRPIQLSSATVRREMAMLLAVSLLVVSLFLDRYLSRIDSLILLSSLVLVIFWMIQIGFRSSTNDPIAAEYEAEIPQYDNIKITLFWLFIGLSALLFGAELLVDGAIDFARLMGVSEVVIGIVLVAFGTSLPELAVSIVSVMKREYGMVLGNIIGSNIFNSLAVIGITALIAPAPLPPSVMSFHIMVMVAFTLGLFVMTYDCEGGHAIRRREGLLLLVSFVAYETYTVMSGFP
ncbi:MAG: calcium/sodium antiporter [Alphaproteobacteria bacterium]|nr:MAG: calcium/sodium antiporter [Alphaproteobacteria bacterium]